MRLVSFDLHRRRKDLSKESVEEHYIALFARELSRRLAELCQPNILSVFTVGL